MQFLPAWRRLTRSWFERSTSRSRSSRIGQALFLAVMALGLLGAPLGAAAEVKWNPGHYLDGRKMTPQQMDEFITKYGTSPHIKGVRILLNWNVLETSKGVYNFALLDEYLAVAEKRGKQLILGVEERHARNGAWAPAYLVEEGLVLQPPVTTVHHQSKLWLEPAKNYFIALLQAIGSRYDRHPRFEGLVNSEGYVYEGQNDPTFSNQLYAKAYLEIAMAVREAMPHTLYFSGWSKEVRDYAPAAEIIKTGTGFFFSDVTPHKEKQMRWFGEQNGPAIQWPSLDRGDTTYVHADDSVEKLYDFKRNQMAISHIVWTPTDSWWTRYDGTLVMKDRWAAIMRLIEADDGKVLHTELPPNLRGAGR